MTTGRIEPGINDVYLVGAVERKPEFVYSEHGHKIYEGMLAVPRRSGEIDHVPIVGTDDMMDGLNVGRQVSVLGRIRHRDRHAYPLSVYRTVVFVEDVCFTPNLPPMNAVKLSGHICRPPYFRTTPRGRDLCELTMAVPRGNGPQDYVLCIAWNESAHVARDMHVGRAVEVSGRFQSREYTKRLPDGSSETRMTHEVSLDSIE